MYHAQHVNFPSVWHSESLRHLAFALQNYAGRARFAHPYRDIQPSNEIGAAVLVLLTHEPCPRLLFTKRSRQLSAHAGEVSFVGGKRDKTDTNVSQTALREAYEEVGLKANAVQIIGYLPCQTAKSGTLVCPVVGLISPRTAETLMGNVAEIERIFWGELEFFKSTPPTPHAFHYDRVKFVSPAWELEGEIVWGLTGRIIASLVQIGFGVEYEWYYRGAGLKK